MDKENLKIIFHSFLRNELIVFLLYKKVSKFQILSVSTETLRETPDAMKIQKKSYLCVIS